MEPHSQRCSYCDVPWPLGDDFAKCPVCREPTEDSATYPINQAVADERRIQAEFGWYLWDTGQL